MKYARFFPIYYLAASLLLVFFSSCDDIFEEDISDKSVLIASPSNGATITDNQLWFVWNKLEGAHSYHIAVVSPKFDSIQSYVCDTILCDSLLNGYKLKLTLPNGEYQWSIQAKNSGYESLVNYSHFKILSDEKQKDDLPIIGS